MSKTEDIHSDDRAQHVDAQDARGGEIILRSRRQRLVFAGGLAAAGIAGLVVLMT